MCAEILSLIYSLMLPAPLPRSSRVELGSFCNTTFTTSLVTYPNTEFPHRVPFTFFFTFATYRPHTFANKAALYKVMETNGPFQMDPAWTVLTDWPSLISYTGVFLSMPVIILASVSIIEHTYTHKT